MKKIKTKDKVCSNCERFVQYYKIGIHNFYACGYGFCDKIKRIIKEDSGCDCFGVRKRMSVTAEETYIALSIVTELKELLKK